MKTEAYNYYNLWQMEYSKTAHYLLDSYNHRPTQKRLFNIEKMVNTCLLTIRQNYKYISKVTGFIDTLELTFYPIRNIKAKSNSLGEKYNMLEGSIRKVRIYDLCNHFIHADIFSQFIPTTQGTLGIFYTADMIKNTGLFYIQLCKLSQLFRMIAEKRKVIIEPDFNESDGKYYFKEYLN